MSHDYADWAIIKVPVKYQKLFLSRSIMWLNCIDSVWVAFRITYFGYPLSKNEACNMPAGNAKI